jgi:hypothetical protein
MLAPLLGAVRADMDRQAGWARKEARRQMRFAVLIGAVAGMGALAAVGALTVGLIALHTWLTPQLGSLAALGIIGAGLLLLALILFVVAFSLRRPGLKTRPALQVVQSAALFRTGTKLGVDPSIATSKDSLRFATDALREGSRSEVLGALALLALAGVIAGRRLRRPEE